MRFLVLKMLRHIQWTKTNWRLSDYYKRTRKKRNQRETKTRKTRRIPNPEVRMKMKGWKMLIKKRVRQKSMERMKGWQKAAQRMRGRQEVGKRMRRQQKAAGIMREQQEAAGTMTGRQEAAEIMNLPQKAALRMWALQDRQITATTAKSRRTEMAITIKLKVSVKRLEEGHLKSMSSAV